MKFCEMCTKNKAALKRPKTAEMICKECFFQAFEKEVHQTIVTNNLFSRGERVAIAASGGKGLSVKAPYPLFLIELQRFDGLGSFDDFIECTIRLRSRTFLAFYRRRHHGL